MKYYTPEHEEFHIGFEYEYKVCNKKEWKKHELKDLKDVYDSLRASSKICYIVRVKYLDKEDIESFGYVYKCTLGNGVLLFENTLDKWGMHKILAYDPKSHNVTIDNGEGYSDLCTSFDGTIKNKSELKRVLKQIGYITEYTGKEVAIHYLSAYHKYLNTNISMHIVGHDLILAEGSKKEYPTRKEFSDFLRGIRSRLNFKRLSGVTLDEVLTLKFQEENCRIKIK